MYEDHHMKTIVAGINIKYLSDDEKYELQSMIAKIFEQISFFRYEFLNNNLVDICRKAYRHYYYEHMSDIEEEEYEFGTDIFL